MNEDNLIRLNKFIASQGVCSRREADRLIEAGQVKINGKIATLGDRVSTDDEVVVNGKNISSKDIANIYLAFNKPRGIVCTSSRKEGLNIIDYINFPERIFPIGRLDKDSEGLILLTNDGSIVNKMMRSSQNKEKEYLVKVDKKITKEFKDKMESGVYILNQFTKPAKLVQVNENEFKLTITQGLNRQIRRMCESLGYNVLELKRLRIMNIDLGNLKTGEWRYIKIKELKQLLSLL